MCGIVGFISKEKKVNLINNFVDDISHRGPDNKSYSIIEVGNKYLHLGSARLSIEETLEKICPCLLNQEIKLYTTVKCLI